MLARQIIRLKGLTQASIARALVANPMSASGPSGAHTFEPGTIIERTDKMGSGQSKPVHEAYENVGPTASKLLQAPAIATVAEYAGGAQNVEAAVVGTLGLAGVRDSSKRGMGGMGGSSMGGGGSEAVSVSLPGQAVGAAVGSGRDVEGGRGGQGMTVGSPTGKARCIHEALRHDHQAAGYRAAEEDELLSQLKLETMVRGSSYKEDMHMEPPRNSIATLAAGAFGKYASAVAKARDDDPHALMQAITPADALLDEDQIRDKLRAEAADALAAEAASHGGLVPRGGVASRVQAAADKYSRLLEEERAGMQGTGQ